MRVVGITVGREVIDGATVGTILGIWVETTVGSTDGINVGTTALTLGADVGRLVGSADG